MRRALALMACLLGLSCGTDVFLEPNPTEHPPPVTVQPPRVDELDVLFVVDDSRSMAGKQEMLAQAALRFLQQLATRAPTVDVQLGVVTSSLGGHGSDACSFNVAENRHARLVHHDAYGKLLPTFQDQGFLVWDPQGQRGGDTSLDVLAPKLTALVKAAGERGCGYEAPMEAWYRFLVAPDPHLSIQVENDVAILEGTDEAVLAQRRAFLRPRSALAIVMLTDENDCSIRDGGQAFFALQMMLNGEPYRLPKPRAACAVDPEDPCCRSCGEAPGPGCSVAQDDCSGSLSYYDDRPHLRCFDQKRRFGIDFMWPTDRYVDGLTAHQVTDRHGQVLPNPVFADQKSVEPGATWPRHVVLTGLVGVPWQDLARRDDTGEPNLADGLMTTAELNADAGWDRILGEPRCYHSDPSCLPSDPLMIESVEPRSGVHPITGDALVGPEEGTTHPINGHERLVASSLQYACVMPLQEPRDCTENLPVHCACYPNNKDPICINPDGEYGQTQFYTSALPGIRELQVLEALGDRGVVGSACASDVMDEADARHGYNPSMSALLRRLEPILRQ